jgi:hypothetical protein
MGPKGRGWRPGEAAPAVEWGAPRGEPEEQRSEAEQGGRRAGGLLGREVARGAELSPRGANEGGERDAALQGDRHVVREQVPRLRRELQDRRDQGQPQGGDLPRGQREGEVAHSHGVGGLPNRHGPTVDVDELAPWELPRGPLDALAMHPREAGDVRGVGGAGGPEGERVGEGAVGPLDAPPARALVGWERLDHGPGAQGVAGRQA